MFTQQMCIDRSIISDVKELEIVGSHLGPYAYSSTMQLLSEKSVKTEKMVTHDLPLSDWRKDILPLQNGSIMQWGLL